MARQNHFMVKGGKKKDALINVTMSRHVQEDEVKCAITGTGPFLFMEIKSHQILFSETKDLSRHSASVVSGVLDQSGHKIIMG